MVKKYAFCMTKSLVDIRFATVQDAETIADLSRSTFYETFAAQNTSENMELFLNEQFTRKKLIDEVGATGNLFLLAYFEGQLAGYVKLREGNLPRPPSGTPALEIARIYVVQSL